MRKHDQRQILRWQSLRQRQVRMNLQPIRRLVLVRLPLRERFARQLLANPVLQIQRLRLAIPHVRFARLRVARRVHNPDVLVLRARAEINLLARQLRLQPLVLLLKILVLEVQPRAIILVTREEDVVVHIRL